MNIQFEKEKKKNELLFILIIAGIFSIVLLSSIIIGKTSFNSPSPNNKSYNVSIDNGLKVRNDDWFVKFQVYFVMSDGSVYSWDNIPPSINKTFWKEKINKNTYKYGVDFRNVPTIIKDNLKYVVLHRSDSQNLSLDDIRIENHTIYIKNQVELSNDDLLKNYSIVKINKTDIVIGNISNNWISEGGGKWFISFDPTITLIGDNSYNSLDFNITQQTGFAHLNITTNSIYDNLVLYLPFDSNASNTTVYDYSPYENDGTINNATSEEGLYGNAYRFMPNGTRNDYISTGINGFNFEQGTISLWYKPNYSTNDTAGMTHMILNVGPYSYSVGRIRIFNNQEYSDIRINHGDSGGDVASQTVLVKDKWYHITYTWNNATGNKTYYLNGVVDTSRNDGVWNASSAPTEIYIGKDKDKDRPADGLIDEVMVFNVALNASQIADIYNNQSARFRKNGTQVFFPTNISQDGTLNRLNITMNTQQLEGSSIKMKIKEWEWLKYNDTIDGDSPTVAIEEGIVTWYHFDNISGYDNKTSLFDWSGNGKNGTVYNSPVWNESGRYGGALDFNGSNYVNISNEDAVNFGTGEFTISMFIKSATAKNTQTQGLWRSYGDGYITFLVHTAWNGNRIYCGTYSGITQSVMGVSNVLKDMNWHNVVCARNSSGQLNIYVDGVLENYADSDRNISSYSGNDTQLAYKADRRFNGMIDEFMILNRSLNDSEVKKLFEDARLKYQNISDWQDIPAGENQTKIFNISTTTTHIIPEFKYNSGANQFYTPLILGNITLESWTSGVAPSDNPPIVTLNSPPDNTANSSTSFTFSCNVTDDFNIANTTLYIWNSTGLYNNTNINTSTGTSLNYSWTVSNFAPDNYVWNCLSYDNASQSSWATANFSLNVTSADSCTYTSGNWNIDCSDNCTISSDVTIDSGSNITLTGTGKFTILSGAKISGWTYRKQDASCYYLAYGTGGFYQ